MSSSYLRSTVMLDPRAAYARWAPCYDQTPNPLTALEERLMSPVLSEFARCDIVDMGCGTGRWLRKLQMIAPRSLIGIDASPEMLHQAKRKCLPSTTLIEADCVSTPIADNSADLVLASFLLSYVEHLGRFAAEAARILRSGATLIVSDVHPGARSYGWRRTFRAGSDLFEVATYPYTVGALISALEIAGLTIEKLIEASFGETEQRIFYANGMADRLRRVESLPVAYWAQLRLR